VTYHLHQAKMPHSQFVPKLRLVIERKRAGKGLRTACSGIVIIATINYMRCIFELNNIEKISFLILNISTNLRNWEPA
jgi:hypothetical protein